MCHVSCVMCQVWCVNFPLSCLICHVSCLMCHVLASQDGPGEGQAMDAGIAVCPQYFYYVPQYTWEEQKSFDEDRVLSFLPLKMRTDLALQVWILTFDITFWNWKFGNYLSRARKKLKIFLLYFFPFSLNSYDTLWLWLLHIAILLEYRASLNFIAFQKSLKMSSRSHEINYHIQSLP